MTETLVAVEVLEPGQWTLRELADEANRQHGFVIDAGEAMVEHAIRAGEALLRARELAPAGNWRRWCDENLCVNHMLASVYMRLARYQDRIRAGGVTGINEARKYIAGEPAADGSWSTVPAWLRDEAQRLRDEGMSQRAVARELGVSPPTIARWTNPEYALRAKESLRRSAAKRAALERALRERERIAAVKRAVTRVGGARAKAYSMGESFQDVLGQAHREETDREAREAWARAGEHYRKMRDEIVRALGVT